ncbi:hypothetical protein AB0M02_23760 [Actinoplanes sp. NPDC051861]|uniref:hypothetical protein n=1 Tax=Actinoplanes sp. NPDC051861 TaxID=3155170 RepID=UPI00343FE7F1
MPDRRISLTLITLVGLTVAGTLAATALLLSAVAIRTLSDAPGAWAVAIVCASAVIGSTLGAWAAQPVVARLVTRALQPSPDTRPSGSPATGSPAAVASDNRIS